MVARLARARAPSLPPWLSPSAVQLFLRQQLGWALATMGLHLAGSLSMTALGWATWRLLRPLA